jgi:Nif-specific ferredoxin III
MPAVLPTRDGREWHPSYLESIDYEACIGCGRCYKVCAQSVMTPIERPVDDDFDEDDDEGLGGQVMSVSDPGNCIGCGACYRTCAKKAHTHIGVA